MSCEHVKFPGGGAAIVCGRGRKPPRCGWCVTRSQFLCDWKVGKNADGSAKTCDKPLCAEHAQEVAPEKHLCPEHQQTYKEWKAAHPEVS